MRARRREHPLKSAEALPVEGWDLRLERVQLQVPQRTRQAGRGCQPDRRHAQDVDRARQVVHPLAEG